jgi:hypothetical protein
MGKIFNKKSYNIEIDCDHNEYCPIYLSYLGEYGNNSEKIKYCKNSNVHFCKKYNLINDTLWNKMNKEEKLKLLKDMNLINFIKNRT